MHNRYNETHSLSDNRESSRPEPSRSSTPRPGRHHGLRFGRETPEEFQQGARQDAARIARICEDASYILELAPDHPTIHSLLHQGEPGLNRESYRQGAEDLRQISRHLYESIAPNQPERRLEETQAEAHNTIEHSQNIDTIKEKLWSQYERHSLDYLDYLRKYANRDEWSVEDIFNDKHEDVSRFRERIKDSVNTLFNSKQLGGGEREQILLATHTLKEAANEYKDKLEVAKAIAHTFDQLDQN